MRLDGKQIHWYWGDRAVYRAMLWDLDGTLTDPKVGITKSVQYALEKMGIEEPNLDNLIRFIGPPLYRSFPAFYQFNSEETLQAVAYYREYFGDKGLYENEPYDGIAELLFKLKQSGRQLVVATSKPTVFAQQILEYFDLAQFFDRVVGSNLDGTRSDKTEVIAYALTHLGNDREHTVMIGDREFDVFGAQTKGISSIGVTYGYGDHQEIEAARPTFIVHTVRELALLLTGNAAL